MTTWPRRTAYVGVTRFPPMSKPVPAFRVILSVARALLAVPWMWMWYLAAASLALIPSVAAPVLILMLIGVFVYLNVVRPIRTNLRAAARLRLRSPEPYARWLALAALSNVAIVGPMLLLHEHLAQKQIVPGFPTSRGTFDVMLDRPGGIAGAVLLVALLAPLVEEFAFRGRMQRELEGTTNILVAIALPALIFAVLHGRAEAVHKLPFAVFAGWVVWRTGSLWCSIVVHTAINTLSASVMALTPASQPNVNIPSGIWPYVVAFGALGILGTAIAIIRIERIARQVRERQRGHDSPLRVHPPAKHA